MRSRDYLFDDVCLTLDAAGSVLSVEAGVADDLPAGVLAVASGLARDGDDLTQRFLWCGEEGAPAIAVLVVVRHGDHATEISVAGRAVLGFPHDLTARELDVLTRVCAGATNAEVAVALQLGIRTVTTHLDRILRKLGVGTRTAAAAVGLEEGLLRLPFAGGVEGTAGLRLGRAMGARAAGAVRRPRAGVRVVRRPLVIGAALPMRGFAAPDGIEMAQATRMAVEEVNGRGGINGRHLHLEIADVDIMDPVSIRQTFTELVQRDVDVLTSAYVTHQHIAHDIAADSGIPYLHAATMHAMEERVRASPERFTRIFQVCPSDIHYAPRFVRHLTALRDSGAWSPSSNRLTVVLSPWSLGGEIGSTDLGVADATLLAERAGWTVDVLQPVQHAARSWADVAQQITRTEPAAVMLGHYLVEGTVAFLRAFRAVPSDTLVYSIYAPSVRSFRQQAGEAAEGLLWATVTGTYSDPLAKGFARRYTDRFGSAPGRSHAGIAYDRVRLVASAWSQVANPRDRDAVAAVLRENILRGVNGSYFLGGSAQTAQSFDDRTGDPSLAQAHLVFQIQDGRQRIVDPAPYAEASFRPQPWLSRTTSRGDRR